MIISLFFIFISAVIFMTYIDRKLWGTIFTPFAVLAWPFLILLTFEYIYLKFHFQYFVLNQNVIVIWLIGLLFFWLAGLFIKLIFKSARIDQLKLQKLSNDTSFTKVKLQRLILVSYPLIIFVGYKVYSLLRKYSFNLADEDFQKNMGSGLIGHSILFLTIITIFLIIFFEKKYFKIHQILIITVTITLSVFYGVKSWIIIPLVSAFFGRLLMKKTKLKVKHILFVLMPFLVFWLIYQISLGFDSSNNDFILKHMLNYMLAGPIGFSEHLNQSLPIGSNPQYAFSPVINIVRFFIGEAPLAVISTYYVEIPTGFNPNVKTFFGTLFIYGGYTFVLTSFVLGLIFYSYLLILCSFLESHMAPFITTLYVFMLGLLFMGWFENYVIHLTLYEAPFFAFLLHYLFKLKINHEDTYISQF